MVLDNNHNSPQPLITGRPIDRRRVCINVSGKRYETLEDTLAKHPETLLAMPQRELFFDSLNREYFFNRNRKAFGAILTYYQTGVLDKPSSLDERIFAADLKFFGFETESDVSLPTSPSDAETPLPSNKILKNIWQLFEEPDSSLSAKVIALLSMIVILLSIVMFCIETDPTFKEPYFTEKTSKNNTSTLVQTGFRTKEYYKPIFDNIEYICIAWFSLEYVLRLLSSPKKIQFLYQPLNIIDLVAILPFYVKQLLNRQTDSLSILRILRLVRVFRVFKLSRYSKGLKILGYTFKASLKELGLLGFFLVIGIVLFASAAYYCEENVAGTKFTSIIGSFWWAIVTMTTVGYGDMYPETASGKLVGSLCVLVGVLSIAFPVPVIVSNFSHFYNLAQKPPEPLDEEYLETPLGNHLNSTSSEFSSTNGDVNHVGHILNNYMKQRNQGVVVENGVVKVKSVDVESLIFDEESPTKTLDISYH